MKFLAKRLAQNRLVSRRRRKSFEGFVKLGFVVWSLLGLGCMVDPVCYIDADCPDSKVCVVLNGVKEGSCISYCQRDADCPDNLFCTDAGRCSDECQKDEQCGQGRVCKGSPRMCVSPECSPQKPCASGFECIEDNCRAKEVYVLLCPDDMAAVDRSFCMDRYEASRPDATATSRGEDETYATSRLGVIPWQVKDNATAQVACEANGKSLCTADQWYRSCAGSDETDYAYGNTYNATTCNGIDAFCTCDEESSRSEPSKSAYPGCYHDCGASFHVELTGSFSRCKNSYGVFDLNGNLWEHIKGGNDSTVRGGAYNCGDSRKLHQCSYIPGTWTPSARGFRCCSAGKLVLERDAVSGVLMEGGK